MMFIIKNELRGWNNNATFFNVQNAGPRFPTPHSHARSCYMTSPKEVLIQSDVRGKFVDLTDSIRSRVAGQDAAVDNLTIALLANGYVLLEGAPGLTMTRLTRLFSTTTEGVFKRNQFTPDLLPSDPFDALTVGRKPG